MGEWRVSLSLTQFCLAEVNFYLQERESHKSLPAVIQTRTEWSHQWAVTAEFKVSLLQRGENINIVLEEAWTLDCFNPSTFVSSLMLRKWTHRSVSFAKWFVGVPREHSCCIFQLKYLSVPYHQTIHYECTCHFSRKVLVTLTFIVLQDLWGRRE